MFTPNLHGFGCILSHLREDSRFWWVRSKARDVYVVYIRSKHLWYVEHTVQSYGTLRVPLTVYGTAALCGP